MIVLGIDPGLATTGYAVLQKEKKNVTALDWGIIETKKNLPLSKRLLTIARDLDRLIKMYHPDRSVVEKIFFAKNAKTATEVAHARGAILLTLERQKISMVELTPLQMKSYITGYGAASKTQVQRMIVRLLNLKQVPKPDDAADALALTLAGMY